MKISSLQKSISKFVQKKFYEIDSRGQCYKNTIVIYQSNLTLVLLGFKCGGSLLLFQAKFYVIKITIII
jgi:hypothetical protein